MVARTGGVKMMERGLSLVEFAEQNSATILAVKDRVAVWALGYVLLFGPRSRRDLNESLSVSERENLDTSIQRLIEAEFVREQEGGVLIPTERGAQFAEMLGLPRRFIEREAKVEISCDVFTIDNVRVADAPREPKTSFIEDLVRRPQLYLQGAEGARYGFVECKVFGDDLLFGYFTQEYLAHYLKYDDNLQRHEDWDVRNYNILFVLPLNSQFLILQDAKFYGAPTLSMTITKTRIQMLLTLLFDHHKIERIGDLVLRPYERVLTKGDMLKVLLESDQPVTQAQLDLGTITYSLSEKLSVFNPREDWNEMLTAIINEYELPNIARVIFHSTRVGTVGKSMLVRALALAGQIRQVRLGRGKSRRIVKRAVPTHVGRVLVSDPANEEDVINILSFLQSQLGLALSSLPLTPGKAVWQMQFEM